MRPHRFDGGAFVISVGLRNSPGGAGHAADGAGADRGGLGEGDDRADAGPAATIRRLCRTATVRAVLNGNGSGSDVFQLNALDLENNWGPLSRAAFNATRNGAAMNFRIGTGAFKAHQRG
ncbi:hypothetical protein SAMN05216489_03257 [Streptomyces sp. 3213]|uniref:hypothetical protein n=1 Tax=Streptomyces sp. 3213.3 TaxID=1855348 RepID=UPI00089AB9F4|nr:hypothetical protein [Streptomyces sp. 3213.3]SED36556.1 hypothetical protein SAMN05216489_03257 [Streptomyces sp. 3213] [Streptomyces sp. 3213.3]